MVSGGGEVWWLLWHGVELWCDEIFLGEELCGDEIVVVLLVCGVAERVLVDVWLSVAVVVDVLEFLIS